MYKHGRKETSIMQNTITILTTQKMVTLKSAKSGVITVKSNCRFPPQNTRFFFC